MIVKGKCEMAQTGLSLRYRAGLGVVIWIGGEGGCKRNEMI